jgi:hypothetical protein
MTKLRTLILALLLTLALITPTHAQWGATPGIADYNAKVKSLTGQGCSLWVVIRWGDSLWVCPNYQGWRLKWDESTDTVTLYRFWRGR